LVWLCVFLGVALLTSSLQGRRRAAELELEKRVEERTAQLVQSQREILEISEREQRRIGHDLHDGLGQELSGIALLSTALAEQLERTRADGAQDADRVANLIHDAIQHTRALARGLCPVDLEDEGLASALRQLTGAVSRLPNVTCVFECEGEVRVDVTTASHLYRIAQEAINNGIRHGRARRISVKLGSSELTVTDDGVGFEPGVTEEGMGLRLMEYRARMIGGELRIRSHRGGGTVVTCRLADSSEE
jgi:two-component system, LuxR family, sensor kinase FixL